MTAHSEHIIPMHADCPECVAERAAARERAGVWDVTERCPDCGRVSPLVCGRPVCDYLDNREG